MDDYAGSRWGTGGHQDNPIDGSVLGNPQGRGYRPFRFAGNLDDVLPVIETQADINISGGMIVFDRDVIQFGIGILLCEFSSSFIN